MPAVDSIPTYSSGKDFPATGGETVTPHDTNELTYISRGIWVGVAGNVALAMADGTTITLVGVAAGTLLPVRAKRVNSTNTTATTMVALY